MIDRIQVPEANGEVEYIKNALLFGHYDSRGGATLLLGASKVMRGIRLYTERMWESGLDYDWGFDDLIEGSAGFIDLVVVGQPLPKSGEAHVGYTESEDGFAWYDVYKWCRSDGCSHKHRVPVAVLRYTTKEEWGSDDSRDDEDVMNELAIGLFPNDDSGDSFALEYAGIGEDAFGMNVMQADSGEPGKYAVRSMTHHYIEANSPEEAMDLFEADFMDGVVSHVDIWAVQEDFEV